MDRIDRIPAASVGPAALANADGIQQPGAEQIAVGRSTANRGSTLQADARFPRREPSSPQPLSSFATTAVSSLADDVNSLAAFEKRLACILSLPVSLRTEPLNALYERLAYIPIGEVRAAIDLALAGERNPTGPLPMNLRRFMANTLLVSAIQALENGATAEEALGTYGRHRGVDVRDQIKFEIGSLAMTAIGNGESVESVIKRLGITESEDIALLQHIAADERHRSVQRNNS